MPRSDVDGGIALSRYANMFHKIIFFLCAAFFFAAGLRAEDVSPGLPPAADRKVSYAWRISPMAN